MFKLAKRLTEKAKKLNPKYNLIAKKIEMDKIHSKFYEKIIPRVQKAKKALPIFKDLRAQLFFRNVPCHSLLNLRKKLNM